MTLDKFFNFESGARGAGARIAVLLVKDHACLVYEKGIGFNSNDIDIGIVVHACTI